MNATIAKYAHKQIQTNVINSHITFKHFLLGLEILGIQCAVDMVVKYSNFSFNLFLVFIFNAQITNIKKFLSDLKINAFHIFLISITFHDISKLDIN